MIQTAIGLPNTCSQCGKRCAGQWWAEHEDAARSGAGLCDECAQPAVAAAVVRPAPVRLETVYAEPEHHPSVKRSRIK